MEDELRIAKIAAITKVYNDIAATGKPTPEQLAFLDRMKAKPTITGRRCAKEKTRITEIKNLGEETLRRLFFLIRARIVRIVNRRFILSVNKARI